MEIREVILHRWHKFIDLFKHKDKQNYGHCHVCSELIFQLDEIYSSLNTIEDKFNDLQTKNKILYSISDIIKVLMRCSSDKCFNYILQEIGCAAEVDRVFLYMNDPKNEYTYKIYEWVDYDTFSGIKLDDMKAIKYETIIKWKQMFEQGYTVSGNRISFNEDIQKLLKTQHVESTIMCPIYHNKQWVGFLGFDDCTDGRVWSFDEIYYIKLLSYIFSLIIANIRNNISEYSVDLKIKKYLQRL